MVEVLKGIRSEISVDKEGKGSITKYGLCQLLGISRSNLDVQQMSKKLVEMLTELGFEDDRRTFENGVPDIAVGYRNLTGKKPAQAIKRYVDKSGKQQTAHVAAYPLDFLPIIENAIELGFGS